MSIPIFVTLCWVRVGFLSKKVKKNPVFCIDIWFSKRYRTTLTCSNKLQICWGYVEWTLARCSCVFFHWPQAVIKCHQPKVEILHFKNNFFSLEPLFSVLTYSDFHKILHEVNGHIWHCSAKISFLYIRI